MKFIKVMLVLLAAVIMMPEPADAAKFQNMAKASKSELNSIRKRNGLKPMKPSKKLMQAAKAHAQDMVKNNLFSHYGSDKSHVGIRAERAGYDYCHIAENLAKGQGDVKTVFNDWMNSPTHKANIFSKQANNFGIVKGPGNVWVLVGGRRNDC